MTGRVPVAERGLVGTVDLAQALDVASNTVRRWHRRHGIGCLKVPDLVYDDRSVVAAGALALLGDTVHGGWAPTRAERALTASVARAVLQAPARFVVATPGGAVTRQQAVGVVACLDLLDAAVVTVLDLTRAAPIARAALTRLERDAGIPPGPAR